ncbi:hypothetical protein [Leifsonia sp. Leaf264]|uniref:hypothetical protein n=1 Tax=Leifsonia sp. Leaf264 TaxID=1736314 RepID=UPI000701A89F|nr:hypothetical protein [Leifsonia sp. Leaf264]KQO98635.1 hypothetical protein ASF30_11270 [Leifsonia sp. Leaf264]
MLHLNNGGFAFTLLKPDMTAPLVAAVALIVLSAAAAVIAYMFPTGRIKAALVVGIGAVLLFAGGVTTFAVLAGNVIYAQQDALAADHARFIDWAADRYDITLDQDTADQIISGHTILVNGRGISFIKSTDKSYYLLADGTELPRAH